MTALNVALWAVGVILIAAAYLQARGPYARMRSLQAADENARRYDGWRGGRRHEEERGVTGADVMRRQLRARVQLWTAIGIAGFVLVFAGFAIR